MWRALVAGAVVAWSSCVTEDCEDVKLLQRKRQTQLETKTEKLQKDPTGYHKIEGKSVYLVMPDRFDRVGGHSAGNNSACDGNQWCNGTLRGITEHLDYIAGMGFDCIWVTPVPLNYYGPDGQSGYGYHGYWAQDWFKIDPNFGTAEDMKTLVQETHNNGMCFILDIVLNHVRPIHSEADLSEVHPFNETSYFHLLNISDMTFDEYAEKMSDWPYPTQGIGAGAQCYLQFFPNGTPDGTNNGTYCNNYPGNNFSKDLYYGEEAHGPPYLKYCSVGNYDCKGYNEEVSIKGWFYDLADLNHTVPFVQEELKRWVKFMVTEYDIDGIRLDTTPYMPHWWLQDVQNMLFDELDNPIQIIGEVTASNVSFHASYQLMGGQRMLSGMENFPLVYTAVPGYCGWSNMLLSTIAQFDLTHLHEMTHKQLTSGLYSNTDLLMNMMDNQDDMPIASLAHSLDGKSGGCLDDRHMRLNAWAWLFMAKGMPVITWGDEQGNKVFRNSLWQFNWDTSPWQYKLLRRLNQIRHEYRLDKTRMTLKAAHKDQFVFYRGPRRGKESVYVFTNNLPMTTKKVIYRDSLPKPLAGYAWKDLFSAQKIQRLSNGAVVAHSSKPLVLVMKPSKAATLAQQITS